MIAPEIQRSASGHPIGSETKRLDLLPDFRWILPSVIGPALAKADFFLPSYGLLLLLGNSEGNSSFEKLTTGKHTVES